MKITESTVALATQRSYRARHQTELSIQIKPADISASRPEVALSESGKARSTEPIDPEKELENNPRLLLIKSLIEALTGRTMQLFSGKLEQASSSQAPAQSRASFPSHELQGGIALSYRESYEESEAVSFQAAGVIRTSDGVEIEFSVDLAMSRYYRQETSLSVASGSLARPKKDPLVINYAAPAATLSELTFDFDIDSDGAADRISLLNAGSAFLALDRNQDGKINSGNELFGTQNGDGFADLARLDSDQNRWIDENDAAFAQLRLWIKDAQGTDQLVDLKSLDIGAIYLGNAKADFSLNDSQNREQGQARAAGIYLTETGRTGTVQQIDLAV